MALSWSAKRQLTIIGIFFLFGIIILGFILYPKIVKDPTCFDGKQNGLERGIDCGGSCAQICPFDANSLVLVWSRAFSSVPGYTTAVAYIDNNNTSSGVISIPYEFRIFDDQGRIATKQGTTFIGAHGVSAIIDTHIPVGNRIPVRATFEFLSPPVWTVYSKPIIDSVTTNITVRNETLSDVSTAPKLSAILFNDSLYDLKDIDVVAIVYDTVGNAITASQTHIFDTIGINSSKEIFFTWPDPFPQEVGRIEILPKINPFLIR